MAQDIFVRTAPTQRRRVSHRSAAARATSLSRTPVRIPQAVSPQVQMESVLLCRVAAALVSRPTAANADLVLHAASRTVPLAGARQLAMYLAHVVLGLSQVQVGRRFGRDRRTVAHALKRVEERRDDAHFDAHVLATEQLLRWVVSR